MSASGPAGDSDKPSTADRIGWLDIPLYPVLLAQRAWKEIPGGVRSALRVIVWLALLLAIIFLLVPYCVGVFRSAMDWKTGAQWEAFLPRFITSPAAAGTAALVAAIIAARSFTKGLNQTKQDTRAKAWWEQFEWVTDRIVPKDPKQERLQKGLALSLLAALEATAEGKFQHEAVRGIRNTYIRGTAVDHADAPLGELRALVREVRTFSEAAWISENKELTGHFGSYLYLLETLVAIRTAWDPSDVTILSAGKNPFLKGRPKTVALVRVDRRWLVVETQSRRDPRMQPESLRHLINFMNIMEATSLIVVALHRPRQEMLESIGSNKDPVSYVHWDPNFGAAELRNRIEIQAGPENPISHPPTNADPSRKRRIARNTRSIIPGSTSRRYRARSWLRELARRPKKDNQHPTSRK